MRQFEQMITNVNMGGYLPASQVKYLVFHFVGAAGQAVANGNYFRNTFRSASAHLFIDPNRTVQVVPLNRVGWHVGDGGNRYGINNDNSIGVELCQDVTTGSNVWSWDFHPDTRKESILVFDFLMKKFNVPIERVVRHYDASRKSCPGNWMANDWQKWKLWKEDLRVYHTTGKLQDSQRSKQYSTKTDTPVKLSNAEIAKQVYQGVWGNWPERQERLEKAGYDYKAVQDEVKKYKDSLNKAPETKTNSIGIYKFNSKVWVRNEPHDDRDVISEEGYMYSPGDTVSLEKIIEQDGWVWGQYTSYSGKQRYVKIGASGGKWFAEKI